MTVRTRLRQGFTLIDLAVVIFIMSLVTALVLPSFTGGNRELGAEARKTAAVLRYLSETATLKKRTMDLKFDLAKNSLTWTGPDNAQRTEPVESLSGVELQSKGIVKEGELTVFFEPLGAREYMRIYLDRDGHAMTVSLNPVSGRVRILDDEED